MYIPPITDFAANPVTQAIAISHLEQAINRRLVCVFKAALPKGGANLAASLVTEVEKVVVQLNGAGYSFGRLDYDGDIRWDRSSQTFCNAGQTASGLTLYFHGFSCRVSWAPSDDLGRRIVERYSRGERSFRGEELSAATIDLRNAELPGADFSECFISADFRGADLEGCRFEHGNVKCCDFRGANLRNASFAGSAIDFAEFADADLNGASFEGATAQGHVLSKDEVPPR